MKRQCSRGFLADYLAYTQETEVPEYFGTWTGLSIVSTSMERKVWVPSRPDIFPNLYIVLVADSGICRKSTAIHQGIALLRRLEDVPQILAQKTTTEGLIERIKVSEIPTIRDTENDIIIENKNGAQGLLVADELSTLLSKDAFKSGLIALLTTLWDSSQEKFEYYTRSHGAEIISEPCFSLLAGSTMSWLKGAVPEEAVGGGFTSRVIFVAGRRPERFIAWPELTPETLKHEDRLVHDLNCIRALEGEFRVSQDARRYFEELYEKFIRTTEFTREEALTGYVSRRHVMIHKVAMCFSASESDEMTLEIEHYDSANSILEQTELYMPQIVRSLVSSVTGEITRSVLTFITSKEDGISRTDLLRRFHHKLNATELDEVLKTLEQSGLMHTKIVGKRCVYQANDTPVGLSSESEFGLVT